MKPVGRVRCQTGPDQIAWYAEELGLLKGKLEQHFGVEITSDGLRQAIQLANETRRLQRRLYELRKREHPPISGTETLSVMVAGTAMPKERYNELLSALLEDLEARDGEGSHRARLLVTGGISVGSRLCVRHGSPLTRGRRMRR